MQVNKLFILKIFFLSKQTYSKLTFYICQKFKLLIIYVQERERERERGQKKKKSYPLNVEAVKLFNH